MHGGMGGGMRSGGMHIGGMGGGMMSAGCAQRTSAAAVRGCAFCACRILAPVPWHRFHHRFHRFAFVGAPFAYAAYDSCWRRVWTPYGLQVGRRLRQLRLLVIW